jgi:hypothetical protein
MGFIAAAIIGSAVVGTAASVVGSRNARKAQNAQNDANQRIADEANRMEMERFYASRGASLDDIDSGEIADKRSAIMPYYLSDTESGIAGSIADKYGELQEAYNPEDELARMQDFRNQLAGAEMGAVGAIQGIYDGSQLSESNQYLENINNSRLQGQDQIDVARQGIADARGGIAEARLGGVNAQAQAMTAEAQRRANQLGSMARTGGVVNNSGLANSQTLQALMNAYSGMAQNRSDANVLNAKDQVTTEKEELAGVRERARINELNETAKMAAYENNLAEQKNFNQLPELLNSLSSSQTAGLNNYFAPEVATSNALAKGGYLMGQGRPPEVNSPAYTAPVKTSAFEHLNAGVQSGLGGYMLAKGLQNSGGFGTEYTAPAGMTTTYNGPPLT